MSYIDFETGLFVFGLFFLWGFISKTKRRMDEEYDADLPPPSDGGEPYFDDEDGMPPLLETTPPILIEEYSPPQDAGKIIQFPTNPRKSA